MRIEPVNLRNLQSAAVKTAVVAGKGFLPDGKRHREAMPPTFSEDQLKLAEKEAHKKGFLEGIEEGKKQQDSAQAMNERKLMQALEALAAAAGPLMADYRALIVQARQDMPKTALSIAHKVASSALDANAKAAVEETVTKCVGIMLGEPKLTVTVHDSLAETLQGKIAALAARNPDAGDITVAGDKALPLTDCRVEWKHGALVRDTAKLWQDIARAVEGMSASAKHDAEKHADTLQAETSKKE